ncbi:hypothetical protein [Gemmatimonas sp.]|uniref:hypothetical protein n=1 Tax=Gemmatimonas sp. TaxID=1962908 RepID=UPI00333E64DB
MKTHLSGASRRIPRARRGVALLTALMTIAVLVSLTAVVGRAARNSANLTANTRATLVARAMAESAVLAARVAIETRLGAPLPGAPQPGAAPADTSALDTVYDALFDPALRTPFVTDSVGDGAFAATLVNVSARLDVNNAGVEGLTTLFRTVAPRDEAARIAARLDAYVRGTDTPAAARDSLVRRDSLFAALLGQSATPRAMRPFDSLDEVEALVGADAPWIGAVAEALTVDGDGRIDRRRASPAVRAAASGSLVDRPTRVLIVARGWQRGSAVTQEIQAVYAIQDRELRLVRWREQSR